MQLTMNEIIGLIVVGVGIAALVGAYMVISRKKRWM